jgi:hypothetical protein
MSTPMIRIHDVENDTVIDREMTTEEIAALNQSAEALASLEAQAQAKATARLAVLEKLGLTAEELAALL